MTQNVPGNSGGEAPILQATFWEAASTQEPVLEHAVAWVALRRHALTLIPMHHFSGSRAAAFGALTISSEADVASALYGDPTGVVVLGANLLNDASIAKYYKQCDTVWVGPAVAARRLGMNPLVRSAFAAFVSDAASELCLIGHDADFIVTFNTNCTTPVE